MRGQSDSKRSLACCTTFLARAVMLSSVEFARAVMLPSVEPIERATSVRGFSAVERGDGEAERVFLRALFFTLPAAFFAAGRALAFFFVPDFRAADFFTVDFFAPRAGELFRLAAMCILPECAVVYRISRVRQRRCAARGSAYLVPGAVVC